MFQTIINWLDENKEWLLSGLGLIFLGYVIKFIRSLFKAFSNKNKGKIRITTSFSQSWVQSPIIQGPVYPMYSFEITNIGNTDILIKDVLLFFCGRKIGTKWGLTNTLTEVGINNNLRTVLKPGEFRKGSFELTSIQNFITSEIKGNKRIRLLVIDSFGNKYFSKKSKYQSFKNNILTSNMVNSNRK